MTHQSRYGWMALGGLLCLFGVVLACKIRDGNRALAQADSGGPVLPDKVEMIPPPKETPEPPRLPVLSGAIPVTPAEPAEASPEVLPAGGLESVKGKEVTPVSDPPPMAGAGSDTRPIVIPASATVPV